MSADDDFPDSMVPSVSHAVDGVSGWEAVFQAVVEVLAKTVSCDEVGWTGIDRGNNRVLVHTGLRPTYDEEVVELLVVLEDHPAINHFMTVRGAAAAQPIRIGDLMGDREFRQTRTWADLFGPRCIDRQLTMLTDVNSRHTAATGWSLNRSGSEFRDSDLTALASLRPLLTALETSPAWTPDPDRILAGAPPSSGRGGTVRLTPREVEVLALLADGLTAVAIGHRLRISPLTVRKHLEHIYEKTGHRDRMQAVLYAQRAGFLRPRTSSAATARGNR